MSNQKRKATKNRARKRQKARKRKLRKLKKDGSEAPSSEPLFGGHNEAEAYRKSLRQLMK